MGVFWGVNSTADPSLAFESTSKHIIMFADFADKEIIYEKYLTLTRVYGTYLAF